MHITITKTATVSKDEKNALVIIIINQPFDYLGVSIDSLSELNGLESLSSIFRSQIHATLCVDMDLQGGEAECLYMPAALTHP